MTLSDERIRALAYTTAFAFLGWTSDYPPQTPAQKGVVAAWTATIAATIRAACAEARSAEVGATSLNSKWNGVVKALSGLHEVYFSEHLTSDVEILDALENLMVAYVAWLD